jgi:hypothetical protein
MIGAMKYMEQGRIWLTKAMMIRSGFAKHALINESFVMIRVPGAMTFSPEALLSIGMIKMRGERGQNQSM